MQKVLWSVESVLLLIMIVWLWENYLEVLQTRGKAEQKKAKRTRQLRPRTPEDCQDCRLAEAEQGPERVKARPAVERSQEPARTTEDARHGWTGVHEPALRVLQGHGCGRIMRCAGMGCGIRVRQRRSGNVGRAGASTRRGWGRRCTS